MQKVLQLLIQLIGRFFQIIPEHVSLAMGKGIGLFWFHVVRYRRALVIDNLQRAFEGEKSRREILAIARKNFIHYGLYFVEFMRIPLLNKETLHKKIAFKGNEHLVRALKHGKGVIVICGHYGNWDIMAVGHAMAGFDVHIITKPIRNKAVDAVWQGIRKSKGVSLIPNTMSGFAMARLLRKNQILGIVFDQHRPESMAVRVNFFGRPASTMRAVALFALKTGCKVLSANNWRDAQNIHHIEVGEELPFIQKENEEEAIRANTQLYNDVLESYIRQHPEQWLWIHRRWKAAADEASTEVSSVKGRAQND